MLNGDRMVGFLKTMIARMFPVMPSRQVTGIATFAGRQFDIEFRTKETRKSDY